MTDAQKQFIEKIAPAAQKEQMLHGVPASLTIAQAILESGWGKSKLTVTANNLFGVKGKYNGNSVEMPTSEHTDGGTVTVTAEFRKYPSWQASIEDHTKVLLSPRYKAVIGESDPEVFTAEIQKAGYATEPDYGEYLLKLINQLDLHKYDDIRECPDCGRPVACPTCGQA